MNFGAIYFQGYLQKNKNIRSKHSALGFTCIFSFLLTMLTACGGGGGGSTDNIQSNPEDENVVNLTLFEGETHIISTELQTTDAQWQQTSGTTINISDTTDTQATVTAPWLIEGPGVAEIEVTAIVDGESITRTFEINILDRRYMALRATSEDTSSNDLYLRYIAASNEESVFATNTLRLTNLAAELEICSYATSPSGQYIAYTIKDANEVFPITCRGIYIVDIDTLNPVKLSRLGLDGQDVIVASGTLNWSPDGSQIAYRGDHGEGITQIYNIDINAATTSYINYSNNPQNLELWPDTDLFPIDDGGNSYGLELIVDTSNDGPLWLNNNQGLTFQVDSVETGAGHPYLASVHGDAHKLQRSTTLTDIIFEVDDETRDEFYQEAQFECPADHICTVPPVLPLPLILIDRDFHNPFNIQSSIDGYTLFMATMYANTGDSYQVLAVTPPVVDNTEVIRDGIVEATDVFDAAWSPTANHLAYASSLALRHGHDTSDEQFGLFGPEIPGQLYLYHDYQPGHALAHERLAIPDPDIDDNFVRKLKWSANGDSIVYARGETQPGEPPFYTSLWLTFVDDERDESSITIGNNTTLLMNLRGTTNYFTDFVLAPDGSGVLILLETDEGPRLRYVSSDATISSESPVLLGPNTGDLTFGIAASFSPNSQYYAYIDRETTAEGNIAAMYIQSIDGSDRFRANIGLQPGESIRPRFSWTPNGNAVIYAITSLGNTEFYLTNVQGADQNIAEDIVFLNSGISDVKVH